MSPDGTLRLSITLVTGSHDAPVLLSVDPTTSVAELIARLIREFSLKGAVTAWELMFEGRFLPPDRTLGSALPSGLDAIPLTLQRIEPISMRQVPFPAAPPASRPVPRAPAAPVAAAAPAVITPPAEDREVVRRSSSTRESDEDAAPARARPRDAAPAEAEERADRARPGRLGKTVIEFKKGLKGLDDEVSESPSRQKSSTQRRATVRYYSRMNPDRVFPLLVMLTRSEVEKVVKRHVEQAATGPLTLATDIPLEIEPVLPGCVCYPPMVVTRLGDADEKFTFHVVPHVLGSVTGARVLIRQDHITIAEIELEIRVVQRTMVLVSGLSALVLPTASAVMNHFGIDFTPKDGANPYLTAMHFVFRQVPPGVMMAALAALTSVLFWFTRPKGRDVFWDITTKPPVSKSSEPGA